MLTSTSFSTMRKLHIPVFRIFYSTTYTFLLLLIILLLTVTPIDHIYQTLHDGKFGNVFVVGGVYLVTIIAAIFIYASRLYTNRTVLAAIPKNYLPVGDGEVGKSVRSMIVESRKRSALVALRSRPKVSKGGEHDTGFLKRDSVSGRERLKRKIIGKGKRSDESMASPPENESAKPTWGIVSHAGWSSPNSTDLPSLEFEPVLKELPNIIEAKAVSLAPPDPAFNFVSQFHGQIAAPPDPHAVSLLQRNRSTSLREYLARLGGLGVLIVDEELVADFVNKYEHARFSTDALSEQEFRELMGVFSIVLAGIEVVDARRLVKRSDQTSDSGSVRQTTSLRPGLSNRAPSAASMASFRSTQSVIHHVAR